FFAPRGDRLNLHIPYRTHILRCMKGVPPISDLSRKSFLHCPTRYSSDIYYLNFSISKNFFYTFVANICIEQTYEHLFVLKNKKRTLFLLMFVFIVILN